MASNLEVVISATDRFSGTANRIIGTLGRMDTAAGRVIRAKFNDPPVPWDYFNAVEPHFSREMA